MSDTSLRGNVRQWALPAIVMFGVMMACAKTQVHSEEVIVFEKDADLWQMKPMDRSVHRWTEVGVGSFSVSKNGKIAFDRFTAYEPKFRDLNIYFSTGLGTKPQKLTSDNKSIRPVISPDGTKILYQKLEWNGSELPEGKGKGIWLYDVEKNVQHQVVGTIEIPAKLKEERNRTFAAFRPGKMDAKQWARDDVLWASDSRRFLFQRIFENGGAISFWVDLEKVPSQAKILDADLSPLDFGKTEVLFYDWANHSLVAIQPESGIRRRIAKELGAEEARLSPDGQRLASSRLEGETSTIWIADSSGDHGKKITGTDFELLGDSGPELEWSLDGSTLMASVPSEDGMLVWLINATTGERRVLGAPITSAVFTAVDR